MPVYVDELFNTVGMLAKWRFKQSCHMKADTEEELHAMAAKLGLGREWCQYPDNPIRRHCQHTPCLKAGACISPSKGVDTLDTCPTKHPLGRLDRAVQPTATRPVGPSPHTPGKLQVELAAKAFAFMPRCACRTIRPIGVNTYHKQFLLSQRSAFVLACSHQEYDTTLT